MLATCRIVLVMAFVRSQRMMRWAVHIARMGDMTNAQKIFFGKPEGKRPLRRPSLGIKITLKWMLRK